MTRPARRNGGVLRGWPARLVWAALPVELVAMTVFWLVIPPVDVPSAGILAFFMIVVPMTGVGALIAIRQPRNTIGWVLWGVGTLAAGVLVALCYVDASVQRASGAWPGTGVVAWVMTWTLPPTVATIVLLVPLLFPNGRLPSSRWRPVLGFQVLATVVLTLPPAFRPGELSSTGVNNPVGIPGIDPVFGLLDAIGPPLLVVGLLLGIAAAGSRYRHGNDAERHQLRWFAASLSVIGMLEVLALLAPGPLADVGWIINLLGLALVPVVIGIAILRYRLYEIDRIISRTLSWTIVTGVLVAAFAVVVVALQALLAGITQGQTLAVAASTLVAFALFQPVRLRVQRVVDRRFNRGRYDAERTLDALGSRLRGQVDLYGVLSDVLATVDASVQPASVALWIRRGEGAP